ncbi:transcriptional regulator, TetR family [Lentzea xinjiangensis]|uniref:Transcriptional regulator, TetR family n=1 Tax=Lentzea xinjiangensis TaxID=402600 RepID=A0A1H9L3A5_9PSEU|nr:TetR/AcrR family transcriptional regulator [Lentzea xinjiangensis]SER05729.1 transcriptional regulator, TetR family [Lentzea xinjiangensis]
MPKQVDYEDRRRRIAEAVCLLADELGPEGVSMRDVAARAQVSVGAVQRCFRSKEEMLLFAVGHVGERLTERVSARLAADPAHALGHAIDEIALLREEHRAEARIWLAFVAQAVVREPLARTLRNSYAALEDLLTRLVAEAAGNGPADPRAEARALLALADGLTTHVLMGHLTAQAAEDVLNTHVAGLRERLRT